MQRRISVAGPFDLERTLVRTPGVPVRDLSPRLAADGRIGLLTASAINRGGGGFRKVATEVTAKLVPPIASLRPMNNLTANKRPRGLPAALRFHASPPWGYLYPARL